MGLASDEVVVVQLGKKPDEPSIVTVNCPDKTGLGCDLCRITLEFGLCITRGDVSTDGQWCFVVLWVVPCSPKTDIQWTSLKNRLLSVCPSVSIPFYPDLGSFPKASQTYLLKLFSVDRNGLLHGKELLHTKKRRDETCEKLCSVLGDSCISCEIKLAEDFHQGFSSLPPPVAEELFSSDLSKNQNCLEAFSPDSTRVKKVDVAIDNSLSPSHTLLQIHCIDQKGLLYDILRILKGYNIQISYGRFMSDMKGYREIDLFIQQTDGKKIVDPEKQEALCSKLKLEMLQPLRVIIVSRGPDTELLVANSVELCGKGRPRVFYDVTFALKMLGVCIFLAEIGKHTTAENQWEVYRFLLEERTEFPLSNRRTRIQIVDKVRRTLMGW
ncbi:hypothetical protein AXF42_Ash014886 [Apostasia shenzhenica]|uniref:ACT domain-containing protein ACR n=1 Tax=Apostasia shenzhenica TaxID=1088818 RepID=A0A2I0ALD8_9ASPA|nr:hypothetical protein AXF42_Ash014886 [Apostasia shenzhenica]